jgi:hypothetical protein
LTQQQQQKIFSDPQTLNSYGYARDNPIVNKDATGLMSESDIDSINKGINAISGLETGHSFNGAYFSSPGNSPQQQESAQAQFKYDAGTFIASTVVTYGLVAVDCRADLSFQLNKLTLNCSFLLLRVGAYPGIQCGFRHRC